MALDLTDPVFVDEEGAFFTFRPRPNNLELLDEQEAFVESMDEGVSFHVGGNGCIAGEEIIYDPLAQVSRRVDEIRDPFHVWSINQDTQRVEIAKADPPFPKGTDQLYEVRLVTGKSFVVTREHRVLLSDWTWCKVGDLLRGPVLDRLLLCLDPHAWNETKDRLWGFVRVESIRYIRDDKFYDLHVPGNNNYWMAGAFHHNSGTSTAACAKLAKFVLSRQEAPRFDTPFWVVGIDYDQTIESIWKEKLEGMGFIPDCEIDWERVTWHDRRRGLPATVPLLPWVNGNQKRNWVIEFRSYAQGRMSQQARSIGGFMLTEQFPWEILTEILRGMREYNFPGSKFCEFTPVDPLLSRPLEEMIEEDRLPEGWRVYRANTRCNVEDPNSLVDQKWFDEFFGMVGDQMIDTRMTGAFATYEGLVYKEFNRQIHVVENLEVPLDCIHKRGIDWGQGPHNAFACLWVAKTPSGKYLFYDEYYTTEADTWEDRFRDVHAKDGYDLRLVQQDGRATYELKPIRGQKVRWRYDQSNYQQTYAPPDQPGLFREARKYCLPMTLASCGPGSYQSGIEVVQALLKWSNEGLANGSEPRILIDKNRCPNLVSELSRLRWQQMSKRTLVNPKAPKMEQVKIDDHAADACRVLLFSDVRAGLTGATGKRVEQKRRPQVRHQRAHR